MVDIDRARRSMQIFSELCAISSADRDAALERLCGTDALLRSRVQAMFAADGSAAAPLASGEQGHSYVASQVQKIVGRPMETVRAEAPDVEGEYTILRIIGEGGMGTVYEAEQHSPRRRVAIKAIRPGRITPQLRKRFEYEAQVLGRLEHPGIARLYEFDTKSEAGRIRAFLAMELVVGEPVDAHCTTHRCGVRDRLRLFLKVCNAVAYAHRMGVIHRDLKPANILVNAEGEPKVLDFGVARTIGDDQPGSVALTEHGQILGTLAYMSPEQVEGRADIDTRSDVYSLGVILYKLLTGVLPINLDNASLATAAEKLLNETPRPIGQFSKRLRGDLEVILARTLEKDRNRRYGSVEQVADEISRFLSGRPIEARGDSTLYLIRKAIWRHRAVVAACLFLMVLLAGFGAYASMSANRNRNLADAAEQARDAAVRSESRATAQAEQLRQSLYISSIGFAQSALENSDIERAHTLLDGCEPALRSWEWSYLNRLCDLSYETHDLNLARPRYVSVSDDRALSAYASLEREVVLFDASRNERLRAKLSAGAARAAVSADGKWLAYGGVVDSVTLVDVATHARRELMEKLSRPADEILRPLRILTFSSDSSLLALAGGEGKVKVWRVADGVPVRTIDLGNVRPMSILCVPDTSIAIIGDYRGAVRAFDLRTGDLVRTFDGHDAPVWALTLSHDRKWLATGDNDARLIVWDMDSGEVVTQLDTNDGWITALSFSNDRSSLAVGRSDATVRMVHLPDLSLSGVLRGHRNAVVDLRFATDGRLSTTSLDGTEKRWDVRSALGVPTIEAGQGEAVSLAFDGDGETVIVGGGEGAVRRWPLGQALGASAAARATDLPRLNAAVLEVALDRQNDRICTTGRDGSIQLISLRDGALIRALPQMPTSVSAAAFSPDGERLLIGTAGKLTLFDPATAAPVRVYPTPGYIANEVQFDRAGTSFYAACSDGAVRKWRLGETTPIAAGSVDVGGAYDLRLSPDERHLAVVGDTASVTLVDANTLSTIRTYSGHQGPITGVAFHPSGKRLATCGNDRSIRVWDLDSGTELVSLRGHRRPVNQIEFSADGATLVSASADGTIKIWKGPAERAALKLKAN